MNSEEQEGNNHAKLPLWARLSVEHTKKTCCIALCIPIVCLFIIRFLNLFKLDLQADNAFLVRSHPIAELSHARKVARTQYPLEKKAVDPPLSKNDGGRQFMLMLRRTAPGGKVGHYEGLDFVKNTSRKSVLTAEGMALLKRAEDAATMNTSFRLFCFKDPKNAVDCEGKPRVCAPPLSITNHPLLYGQLNGTRLCRSNSTSPVPEERFKLFLTTLSPGGKLNPRFSIFFGADINATTLSTQIIRSFIPMGKPLSNSSKDEEAKKEEFSKWALGIYSKMESMSNAVHHIQVFSGDRIGGAFTPLIARDMTFAILGVLLVMIVVWLHTTSSYLTIVAVINILLAFPLTYVVYRGIFRITYFSTLQVMTIFLILGIGADDAFVFVDAWKQAPVVLGKDVDLGKRMAWCYSRSVKAMAVTSFTTAIAFFCSIVSPIMPIATLGVWAGLLVLFQFILVITVYPSAVVIWQRFWRVHRWYRFWKRRAEECSSTNEVAEKDSLDDDADADEESTGTVKKRNNRTLRERLFQRNESELRPVEKFFNGPWCRITRLLRYPLLFVALVTMGISIWLATLLETPVEAEKFLPDNHPLMKALSLTRDAFPSLDGEDLVRTHIIWGLKGIDRSRTNRYDPADLGEPIFDAKFSMKTAAAQKRIFEACAFFSEPQRELLANSSETKSRVDCWPESYMLWRTKANRTDFQDFTDESSLIADLLAFGNTSRAGRMAFSNQRIVLNNNRTRILYAELEFVGPLRGSLPYSITWPYRERWERALNEFNINTSAPGVQNARLDSGPLFIWAVTQKALVDNMYLGIGIVIAVALVTLTLSTGNIIVALLALGCISGILTNVLAIIYVVGWKLGVTESIAVVISVGFSFDYVAHIANAYVESPQTKTREERTRDALTELGISIIAGAISTLLAGSMLLFAVIIFFRKFGTFITATVSLAVVWGVLFFPALLHLVGPEGEMGELWTFFRKLFVSSREEQYQPDST